MKAQGKVTPFILKINMLINHPANVNPVLPGKLLDWSTDGKLLVINNLTAFAINLLRVATNQSSHISFTRQLNSHGFIKMDRYVSQSKVAPGYEQIKYKHVYFQRDQPENWHLIKRKIQKPTKKKRKIEESKPSKAPPIKKQELEDDFQVKVEALSIRSPGSVYNSPYSSSLTEEISSPKSLVKEKSEETKISLDQLRGLFLQNESLEILVGKLKIYNDEIMLKNQKLSSKVESDEAKISNLVGTIARVVMKDLRLESPVLSNLKKELLAIFPKLSKDYNNKNFPHVSKDELVEIREETTLADMLKKNDLMDTFESLIHEDHGCICPSHAIAKLKQLRKTHGTTIVVDNAEEYLS